MEKSKFFTFNTKSSSTTLQVHAQNLEENDDYWKLILGNYTNITFPVIFKHEHGKKLHDILNTGWPSLYLISEKMRSLLETESLTGWEPFDVKIFGKDGSEIFGYCGMSITGRSGPKDYSDSQIIEKRTVENGPISNHYIGLNIGADDWDGSDFFITKGSFGTYATKRAVEAIQKAKLSNTTFQNITEVETWEVGVENYQKNLSENLKFFERIDVVNI